MAAKRKRGLSKGLDALLSSSESYQQHQDEVRIQQQAEDRVSGVEYPPRDGELRHLPVECMERGRYQPRSRGHAAHRGAASWRKALRDHCR
jgi:ParB family chromosome partitioning protein